MKTILEALIKNDPALGGFKPDELPHAAMARIAACLKSGGLDCDHSHADLDEIEAWVGKLPEPVFEARDGECAYFVFPDDSLYFRSSGDSEVWAFASDFASDKVIPAYDGSDRPIDEMDERLLTYLGGFYAEFVAEKKGEQAEA